MKPNQSLAHHQDQDRDDPQRRLVRTDLTADEFRLRLTSLDSYNALVNLRNDSVATENLYRELFSRKRDSWEIDELDDPYCFLLKVHAVDDDVTETAGSPSSSPLLMRLPRFPEDKVPRCFELPPDKHLEQGTAAVVNAAEFLLSWDCLTEGQLKFMKWDNVFAAGGAVAGCLMPGSIPPNDGKSDAYFHHREKNRRGYRYYSQSNMSNRVKNTAHSRRKYLHDIFLPGSDVDLFLYGLNEKEAERKLVEIYEAVQRANPNPVLAFRSTHAITLVSQYPFRHIQIVLRLYNSPSEVLMGFDVDSCAAGYDGYSVYICPRTALSFMTQSNVVDMSRRSPSYEVRLAKYADRGFEVVVPSLDRGKVNPALYEKRFHEVKGLSKLLLMERFRTPEERLRHRLQVQLQNTGQQSWKLNRKIRRLREDRWNLERDGSVDLTAPEMSNYSTIFLPWGPQWDADRCADHALQKDRLLNTKAIVHGGGRVVPVERGYQIHQCAVGSMQDVINDPFPQDSPLPDEDDSTLDQEMRSKLVHGPVTFLVDNPGRQQIGSFHPITDDDWTRGYDMRCITGGEGAMNDLQVEDIDTDALMQAIVRDDDVGLSKLLMSKKVMVTSGDHGSESEVEVERSVEEQTQILWIEDFLGRRLLHLAVLANATKAVRVLLGSAGMNLALFRASCGHNTRSILHVSSMFGNPDITHQLLEKRAQIAVEEEGRISTNTSSVDVERNRTTTVDSSNFEINANVLDINKTDPENYLTPLQICLALGDVTTARSLIKVGGADVNKVAVHQAENGESVTLAPFTQVFFYALQSGEHGRESVIAMTELLLDSGASMKQLDTDYRSCWHYLAASSSEAASHCLEVFLSCAQSKYFPSSSSSSSSQTDDIVSTSPAKSTGNIMKRGLVRELGLDLLDKANITAIYLATVSGSVRNMQLLLDYGASPFFNDETWQSKRRGPIVMRREHYHRYSPYHHSPSGICPTNVEHLRQYPMFAVNEAEKIQVFLQHDASIGEITILLEPELPQHAQKHQQRFGFGKATQPGFSSEVEQPKPQTITVASHMEKAEHKAKKSDKSEGDDEEHNGMKVSLTEEQKKMLREQMSFFSRNVEVAQRQHDASPNSSYESYIHAIDIVQQARSLAYMMKFERQMSKGDGTMNLNKFDRVAVNFMRLPPLGDFVSRFYLLCDRQQHQDHRRLGHYQHQHQQQPHVDKYVDESAMGGVLEQTYMPLAVDPRCGQTRQANLPPSQFSEWETGSVEVQPHVLPLMQAISSGNVMKVTELLAIVPVSIWHTSVLQTPLFVAVWFRQKECIKLIFDAGRVQFERYVKLWRLQEVKIKAKAAQIAEELAAKKKKPLSRLNNFELNEGNEPGEEGPTPDDIRQQLAAMQQAEDKKEGGICSNDDDDLPVDVDLLSSSQPMVHVSPACLFQQRCMVSNTVDESLMQNLRVAAPDPDPEDRRFGGPFGATRSLFGHHHRQTYQKDSEEEEEKGSEKDQLFLLNAFEVAILRKDTEVLQLLFSLCETDVAAGSGDDDDDDGTNVEPLQNIPIQGYRSFKHTPFQFDPWTWKLLICCDGMPHNVFLTSHMHLQKSHMTEEIKTHLNLLPLSVAVDDVETFRVVARYARELLMNSQFLTNWMNAVHADAPSDKKQVLALARQIFPLMTAIPYQLLREKKSASIRKAIRSGQLDDVLVDWLMNWQPTEVPPYFRPHNEDTKQQKKGCRIETDVFCMLRGEGFRHQMMHLSQQEHQVHHMRQETFSGPLLMYHMEKIEWITTQLRDMTTTTSSSSQKKARITVKHWMFSPLSMKQGETETGLHSYFTKCSSLTYVKTDDIPMVVEWAAESMLAMDATLTPSEARSRYLEPYAWNESETRYIMGTTGTSSVLSQAINDLDIDRAFSLFRAGCQRFPKKGNICAYVQALARRSASVAQEDHAKKTFELLQYLLSDPPSPNTISEIISNKHHELEQQQQQRMEGKSAAVMHSRQTDDPENSSLLLGLIHYFQGDFSSLGYNNYYQSTKRGADESDSDFSSLGYNNYYQSTKRGADESEESFRRRVVEVVESFRKKVVDFIFTLASVQKPNAENGGKTLLAVVDQDSNSLFHRAVMAQNHLVFTALLDLLTDAETDPPGGEREGSPLLSCPELTPTFENVRGITALEITTATLLTQVLTNFRTQTHLPHAQQMKNTQEEATIYTFYRSLFNLARANRRFLYADTKKKKLSRRG